MQSSRIHVVFFLIATLAVGLLAKPTDGTFSQWRGLNRDGVYHEQNLLKSWPDKGPKMLWTAGYLGKGYSSAAVTKNTIFTTGMIDGTGFVFAFNKAGKLLWKTPYGQEWSRNYEGSRTTPTVVGDRLYIEGTGGEVFCLNSGNGDVVWKTSLIEKYGARKIRWGLVESLLIDGDQLICTPGGTETNLIALNRHDGSLLWSSKGVGDKAAYCSPTVFEHGGKRTIVTMTGKSILGVNAENGKLLWSHPHITSYDINPNTPYYLDGRLYCVSGYGTGGVQLELSPDGTSVKEVWRNKSLDVQMDAFVVVDGFIYGTSHKKPAWHCLDWKTGEERYVDPGIGKGNVIFSDGLIYCYGDNGKVGLIEPDPDSFKLISSFKISQGTNEHWAHSVISDGVLYIRHGNTMMAYDIQG